MKSYDIYNNTIIDNKFDVETDFSDPGPIDSIKFENVRQNDSSLATKISWKPPLNNYCINFYDLQWSFLNLKETNHENVIWHHYNHTDIKNTEFLVKNLNGCLKYMFKIIVNGDEINNSYNSTFTSSEQDLGPVKDLSIQTLTSTTITLIWKTPELHNECIKKYKIDLFDLNGDNFHNMTSTTETKISFEHLKPCGIYKFIIKPITINNHEGETETLQFKMKSEKPTVVRNLTAICYPNRIILSWIQPEFSELCIKHYRIVGWINDDNYNNNYFYNNKNYDIKENVFSNVTTDTNITFDNLMSCTIYTIQVIATTGDLDGTSNKINCETDATSTNAPENIEILGITHNSLEIRAQNNDNTNNCQVLYVKFLCSTNEDVPIKTGETVIDATGLPKIYSGIVKPLSPYTKYSCRIIIYNIAGASPDSALVFQTGKYYPGIPIDIHVNHTTSNSIHFLWKPPKHPNGEISVYKIHIKTLRPLYHIPNSCPEFEVYQNTIEVSKTEYTFQDTVPYTEYSIQIATSNDYGMGEFSSMLRIITNASNPSRVSEFDVAKIYGPSLNELKYESSVLLKWKLPCRSNGLIKLFELTFIVNDSFKFIRLYNLNFDPLINGIEYFSWNETELLPEYKYYVKIKVYLEQNNQESDIYAVSFQSPSGIPHKLNISGNGVIDAFLAKNPTTTALAKVSYDIFKSEMGNIMYAAFLVSEKGCQSDPKLEFNIINSAYDWPNISNWFNAQLQSDCIRQYQTTPVRWIPSLDNYDVDIENKKFISYIIGLDKNCDNRPDDYCNGPLKPGTRYNVVLRLFTKSGYNDVAKLSFETDYRVQFIIIVLLAIICLLFAFILGIIYLWVTKRIRWHQESMNGMENNNGDITGKNFLLHYTELSKREKIQREFKELTVITSDLDLSNNASKLNESKNRYSNIYPYDKNRVILDPDDEGFDYINASFINGYKKKKQYIATQGPKQESVIDFWRMIFQYNVRIIVMLTEMRESDTIKCHQYFPYHLSDCLKIGHHIAITCKKQTIFGTYEKRDLNVVHNGYSLNRNVAHYFFKKWPDHDCPSDPIDLINFIQKIKSEKILKNSPIVVHCSAGVGRTGTFIGLDFIMQRLKCENKINIFETVKELRFQRLKMVQTIQQYQFLYKCAYQLVLKNFSTKNSNNNCNNSINNITTGGGLSESSSLFKSNITIPETSIINIKPSSSSSSSSILSKEDILRLNKCKTSSNIHNSSISNNNNKRNNMQILKRSQSYSPNNEFETIF